MKKCTVCGQEKDTEHFYKNSSKSDGLQNLCKSCKKEFEQKYRKRKSEVKPKLVNCKQCGKEVTVGKSRVPIFCSNSCKHTFHRNSNKKFEWLNNNYDKLMFYRIKARAKSQKIPFNLTLEDFLKVDICPVLGIKLEYGVGKGYHPSSPSLDRIDPVKGYTKGNVRIISSRANLLKNNATIEELEKVLLDLKQTTILSEVSFDV